MSNRSPDHHAIIVGGGVCGIYMLHRLIEAGTDVQLIEGGEDLGGTWYWNRYPGARFDSESYTYGYSFSKEILAQWNWSEHFAPQPETLRYLNFVADQLNLRPHMRFGARVQRARWVEADRLWELNLEDGSRLTTRFLLTALGMLSAATLPRIDGMDTFQGPSFHTYHWPRQPVDLDGKRVAVIGTGATGVQVIADIADKVGQLTVFQRRPNWCAPLHNAPITEEEQAEIKATQDEIFARCAATPNGFLHGPDRRPMWELSVEERLELWERLYASKGFGVWLGNFREVLMDPAANAEYSAFIAEKIRQRVDDPQVAEKLIPKDHGFGTRRVPLETRYYEAYNRDNVRLVDLNETPIERVTERGIRTSAEDLEFDLIVYATGFDAITGAYDRVEIIGTEGRKLSDKWKDGPVTWMGSAVHGFPNLVTLAGPQSASVSTNFPPAIESHVNWAADLMAHLDARGCTRIEAQAAAEQEWQEEVRQGYAASLLSDVKSWLTGYNSNVDDHQKLRHVVYLAGAHTFRNKLRDMREAGYRGFTLDGS